MIDQRVSEKELSKFFNDDALTTTIPAQFVKKFDCKVVPIYIERHNNINFNIKIKKPIEFSENDSIEKITRQIKYLFRKNDSKKS